jgi:Dyp-type peroxidase family
MTHDVLTIVAPVSRKAEPAARLRRILGVIGSAPATNPRLPFGKLPMVHFASFVVFANAVQERRSNDAGDELPVLPEQLVFESCIDGPIEEYLEALLHLAAQTLHDIFSCCRDYPGQSVDHKVLKRYLLEKLRRPNLLHIGNPGLRVDHIAAGATLRRVLDTKLDEIVKKGRTNDRPLDLMRALRDDVKTPPSSRRHWFLEEPRQDEAGNPRYRWFSDQQSFFLSRLKHWSKLFLLVGVPFLGLAAFLFWLGRRYGVLTPLLVVAALFIAYQIFWRWLKRGRPVKEVTPEQAREIRAIKELEDKGVQNKMASLVILKPGWLTALTTRTVLGLFNLIYRTLFTDLTPGRLAGLHTIHFGHWTLLDLETEKHGRQKALMFLSNYDGSWETYLDDFLHQLFNGVVAIWSGGVGFPRPLDGPIFKTWARTRMSTWQAWYQAYPALTVANIENNDHIRQGLLELPKTDEAARLWLSRFGSFKNGNEHIDAPPDALETDDIQGLVLSGYPRLPNAAYIMFRIQEPDRVRKWIAGIAPHITDARPVDRGKAPATNFALTESGLTALGLDKKVLARFPLAFQEGMAPRDLHHRSRILGDVEKNAPDRWAWGGTSDTHERVDMLLMVFAESDAELTKTVKDRLKDLSGATEVTQLIGNLFKDEKGNGGRPTFREHFGFVDGISQPEIEGTQRASTRVSERGSQHLVKPGEFLLGYVAGDGSVTPAIPLEADLDVHALLPPANGHGPGSFREFGRNGTFLVFRQLQQDVPGFKAFVEKAGGAAAAQSPDEFSARLVGRHRDGAPLIAGTSGSNEFVYAGDPHGFACPVGAHVRRANPRDALADDRAMAMASANRHRLLRRGRPYGKRVDGASDESKEERGMLFICLNGDIERQFEFVQQNWINNSVFGGLANERDGLVGASADLHGILTVQQPTVRRRTLEIPSFVTMRGGAYFFLPGLSTVRYLASLTSPTIDVVADMPSLVKAPDLPVKKLPSRLRRLLTAFESRLDSIRLAWAARFPALLAFVLIVWPIAATWRQTYLGSHFLVGWWGLASVACLASLAAFVVMITLRLVLLYGWRSRPVRPRWTGSARWFQVLGFQALALPLVLTALHRSAQDNAGLDGKSYWDLALEYLVAAGIGMTAALALLAIASSLQALRPGSRPDLFFPPNPLASRLGAPGGFRQRLRFPSAWLTRLSKWIVSSVPEEIGVGYIDYRLQRILPGHAFAALVALIVFLVYAVGYVALNPAWDIPWLQWDKEVPALAYLTFMLIVFGSLLAMIAFFFDRWGIPTLLPLVAWLAIVASVARTDHFYKVHDVVQHAPLKPADVVVHADKTSEKRKVIIVASEGLGLTSSAWTAEVLAKLTEESGGRPFTDALRLVSASSGAALGTLYFVEAYEPDGFPTGHANALARIRDIAGQPSDSENAWGLVYPDLVRTFAPLAVPGLLDRGWAMEHAWRRRLKHPEATLAGWRQNVFDGWRPATAFGVTVVETGGRHVFASYDANPCLNPPDGCPDNVTHGRDLPVVTAARLASTFPYVTPATRAQVRAPAYHLTDGGFWDNFGIVAAVEWLKEAAPAIKEREKDVMLIEIRSSAPQEPPAPEDQAWVYELIGPLQTMNAVRVNAQRARNDLEVVMIKDLWPSLTGRTLSHVVFNLGDPEAKLAWRVGRRDLEQMTKAWSRNDNRTALDAVKKFLGVK